MNEQLRLEVLQETNLDVLRTLVLVADQVIEALEQKLELAEETIDDLIEVSEEDSQDATRYQLLKLQLPSLLEVAAYFGTQNTKSVEVFGGFDPSKLDEVLDKQIADGTLDYLLDQQEQEIEAALDAQGDVADEDEDEDQPFYTSCGDPDCPLCDQTFPIQDEL